MESIDELLEESLNHFAFKKYPENDRNSEILDESKNRTIANKKLLMNNCSNMTIHD